MLLPFWDCGDSLLAPKIILNSNSTTYYLSGCARAFYKSFLLSYSIYSKSICNFSLLTISDFTSSLSSDESAKSWIALSISYMLRSL